MTEQQKQAGGAKPQTVPAFTAKEFAQGYGWRDGVKTYCCYGMYVEIGHSNACPGAAQNGAGE